MKAIFVFILSGVFSCAGAATSEVVQKLRQNIERLDQSINITKEKVRSPKEVEFLPDIYLSLAELYIEKARYMYALKLELKAGTPVDEIDFTAEKRIKQEAIDTLQSLLDRYAKYNSRDKVLFSIAHEYREINDSNRAMKYYKEITDKFPDSSFWSESQFALGMIFYDKKDYEFAKQQFDKIVAKVNSPFIAQAYYKIGQCEFFMDKYLNAMLAYEKSLAVERPAEAVVASSIKDVREEVLIASVMPLSDLSDQDLSVYPRFLNPLDYYRELSFDKAVYRRVLQRLGRRLSVKNRHYEAAKVNYELMRLSTDPEGRRESFESYYLAMKTSKKDYFPENLAEDIFETFSLMKLNRIEYKKYEPAYRDIVTRFHTNSNAANRIEDFKMAADIYENYLQFFPREKHSANMKINLAESYFKAEKYIEASILYSDIARTIKNQNKAKEFYLSALEALEKSFVSSDALTVLERFQSRIKYRDIAKAFLKRFKNSKENEKISFNIAKSFYDEKNFEQAVKSLRQFVSNTPNGPQSTEAVLLLLDTYYIRDDLKGLVNEGNALLSRIQFTQSTKTKIQDILQQAQLKNVKSLAGDFGSKKYAENIVKFARSNKNSTLGENALFEAFTALKAQNDEKAFEIGEDFIASFPKSAKAKEILLTMTQMALVSMDLKRAQRFLTAFSQKFPDDEKSSVYLQQAALIAEQRGDLEEAANLFARTGNVEKQAQMLFLDANWLELQKVASRISGSKGIYYSGLSMYRQGKKQEGLNLLRRLQNFSSNDFEAKSEIAHAGYIISYEDSISFESVGSASDFTPQVLKQKIQVFQEVDKQIQEVIKLGIGRWALAALYLEGKLNQQMVHYLSNVKTPSGMTSEQIRKVLDPQIKKYRDNTNSIFSQCLVTAEENNIFTSFVQGCRSQGASLITEDKDIKRNFKSSSRTLASEAYTQIRRQIYREPRNVKVIYPLVKIYIQQGDYSSAFATLARLQELEPTNQTLKAEMGVVSLFMNNLDEAYNFFQDAYAADSANKTAIWGLKALYKKFNYTKKLAIVAAKSKSVGRPDGFMHPWMLEN
ncbi:MAG: tetratricopeptide repeat protein [Bdellovibrionaceae bacterium]|nr:tetratricopeptide repeat protein [Pseudobdellovibrionaceae bacterium]